MQKLLEKYLAIEEPAEPHDALADAQAASVQAKLPGLVEAAVEEAAAVRSGGGPLPRSRRCAFADGFSLHANVHIRANDRQGLERLSRYAGRPPLALERLERMADGRLSYRLKRTWREGQTHLFLSPLELLGRLAAIVPPPRRHLTRYMGVFSSHSSMRALVVPQVGQENESGVDRTPRLPAALAAKALATSSGGRPRREPAMVLKRRLTWAALLQRIFAIDILECARCGGRMRVLCIITDRDVAAMILDHLDLPTTPPVALPARGPPTQPHFEDWPD
jgi:hypothetical protein